MKQVHVGKNVVRILNREFPVDTDLSMLEINPRTLAWEVKSTHQLHGFTPIVNDEVTAETFTTYKAALTTSMACGRQSKVRELLARKDKGVKIIPGHGVFILPSKMTVEVVGHRNIKLRVFSGSTFSKSFHSNNYKDMVAEATGHYCQHIREFTDTVNESLYYPVKYNRSQVREYKGIILPDGVTVDPGSNAGDEVRYSSSENGHKYFGTAKSQKELQEFIDEAERIRRKEHQLEAIYRFVTPTFIQLSQYMRQL